MTRRQTKYFNIVGSILAVLLGAAIMIWDWSIGWMFALSWGGMLLSQACFALYNEPPQRFVRWRAERRRRRGGGHSGQPLRGRGAPVKAPRVSSR